jgi:hypothetical protein
MKTICDDRGERIDENEPPKIDVHGCKSLTSNQRAVLLAEAMLRANQYLPGSAGDWEDAAQTAVNYVNDHLAQAPMTGSNADVHEVLVIIAQRSRISYWRRCPA